MRFRATTLLLTLSAATAPATAPVAAQNPWSALSADAQIRLAVQAAPADFRQSATVQGYDAAGDFVTLREGTGPMICMAPDPAGDRLEVSCHHRGLDPFFVRGRSLRAEGVTGQDRVRKRWQEYEAGALPIPYGSTNYILTGSGFDEATGEITDAYLRWTIYTPNATPESTGLSTTPGAGNPWLMFPGTPGAHIMITPPQGGGAG